MFLDYLDPAVPLTHRVVDAFDRLGVTDEKQRQILAFLAPLRLKHFPSFEHSLRVGLLNERITTSMQLDGKLGIYAGLLHDIGKAQTNPTTLNKTAGWTEADSQEIASHVMDGYRLIRGYFDMSAEVILWHHKFQPRGYPCELPLPLHDYSRGTLVQIPFYGRALAIADTFDALHRVNDKHGDEPLTGEKIKEMMFKYNPDLQVLLTRLYDLGILTTQIFAEQPAAA